MTAAKESPQCPEQLSDGAKKEWQYIVPILESIGVISKLDKAVLAEYCESYSQYIRLAEIVKNSEELTFITEGGFQQQIPAVSMMNKAAERMMKAGDKLGLSPSARSGINVNGGGGTDGEDLLD